jgi:hypothetical protein
MKAIKSYTDGIHYRKDLQGVRSFINTLVLVPASSVALLLSSSLSSSCA